MDRSDDPERGDGVPTGDSTVIVVPRDVEAVAGARAHLSDVAASWALEDRPTLELVATELITNAIVHGRGRPIVRLARVGGARVRLEVADAAPERPVTVVPFDNHTRGLGLHIVDAMCDEWGVTEEGPESKVVWASLILSPGWEVGPGS